MPIIFVISNSNTRLKTLTMDYEQQIHAQAEHYKNLAEANYEVRKFRHDFKNIQIAIETLFTQGKYDEAMALLRQCGHSLENPPGLHPKFDTGNGIADALLTDKQEKAVGHNTHIVFRSVIPPETLSPTDLCVLLGNSLDNALDACKKMPIGESKTVSIACDCSSGFLFLTVTNPIAERVQINNNHIVTTKENKTLHGFGLYSLHSIVKKYDGDIQLSATEDSFTIHIDLCLMPAAKPAAAI
ncbi:MAG: sensor histidine kinase [Oscillospiraceae bacterium]|nr:sensor histidine kinase [Oscillospiraceae bacterium]